MKTCSKVDQLRRLASVSLAVAMQVGIIVAAAHKIVKEVRKYRG